MRETAAARSRPHRVIGAAAVAALVVTAMSGCANAAGAGAGAPTPTPPGPVVVQVQPLPSLAPRPTSSGQTAPHVEVALQALTARIDQALVATGDSTPAARLSQKAAAGDQVLVQWVLGKTWPDPGARDRVRADVLAILELVRQSRLTYGSVLMLATGASFANGKKKISIVVRAKYTSNLVRKTDWTQVSPSEVLGMCDDKPAVIAVGYR